MSYQPFYKRTVFILFISVSFILGIWYFYPNYLEWTDSKNISYLEKPWYLRNMDNLELPNEVIENSNKEKIGGKYGTYGDSYGSLNTLFTGLAFAGLIISIILQGRELKATRKEMNDQKEVMREQKIESEKQNKILENQQQLIQKQFDESKKQAFLNQYYALLDQRQKILSSLVITKLDGSKLEGNEVIAEYVKGFRSLREQFDTDIHDDEYMNLAWDRLSKKLHKSYDYQLVSYFKFYRMFFSLIQKNDALSDSEKTLYINILKNFISVEEQLLLMWLGCFKKAYNLLCCKYSLLSDIYNPKLEPIGLKFYKVEAFGNSKIWKQAFEKNKKTEA